MNEPNPNHHPGFHAIKAHSRFDAWLYHLSEQVVLVAMVCCILGLGMSVFMPVLDLVHETPKPFASYLIFFCIFFGAPLVIAVAFGLLGHYLGQKYQDIIAAHDRERRKND